MRTGMRPSTGFLPLGTSFGSKSAGMYLFRTLRSPIIDYYNNIILMMRCICGFVGLNGNLVGVVHSVMLCYVYVLGCYGSSIVRFLGVMGDGRAPKNQPRRNN